jgi:hypothetical protein
VLFVDRKNKYSLFKTQTLDREKWILVGDFWAWIDAVVENIDMKNLAMVK